MRKASLSRKEFVLLGVSAAGSALLALACSGDDSPSTGSGSGGSSSGSGGSSSGSGGSSSTGGSTGTGGTTDTGGSTGSGGTTDTGGSTGTGGDVGSGGSTEVEGGTGGSTPAEAGGNACSGDMLSAKCSPSNGEVGGHTHTLTIPVADVMAAPGAPKSYQTSATQGAQDHCHQVSLTVEDFATLRSGGVVKKTSCNGGNHEFVISCGEIPDPGVPMGCGGNGDNTGACP
jgi:hypothetical protein